MILADPPWRFENWSAKGENRAASNHYATMTAQEILAYPTPKSRAAKDCVLFLWATAPLFPLALSTMQAWGFKYKTTAVWVKDRIGTGYWFRNQHELLLVGTKGRPKGVPPSLRQSSIFQGKRGRHSEKPEAVHEFIERTLDGPYLELFGRRRREGWTVLGDEVSSRTYNRRTEVAKRFSTLQKEAEALDVELTQSEGRIYAKIYDDLTLDDDDGERLLADVEAILEADKDGSGFKLDFDEASGEAVIKSDEGEFRNLYVAQALTAAKQAKLDKAKPATLNPPARRISRAPRAAPEPAPAPAAAEAETVGEWSDPAPKGNGAAASSEEGLVPSDRQALITLLDSMMNALQTAKDAFSKTAPAAVAAKAEKAPRRRRAA